jgi:hypothetical protein
VRVSPKVSLWLNPSKHDAFSPKNFAIHSTDISTFASFKQRQLRKRANIGGGFYRPSINIMALRTSDNVF